MQPAVLPKYTSTLRAEALSFVVGLKVTFFAYLLARAISVDSVNQVLER